MMYDDGISRKRTTKQITLTFIEWPVNRPSIFSLEIAERASENKNREGFIDRKRKEVGAGKGENRRNFFSRARSVTAFTKLSVKERTSVNRLS